MRQQFLYGRTSTGYCQLNQDYSVDERKDLMQLETLQNYLLVDGADMQDLPLEYYAYADKIGGKKVWIEGLTSFVPGGTSQESGSRDTSMIHKYIYSEEDYEKRICVIEEEEKRIFYSTVEDYQQGKGEDIESAWEKINLEEIRVRFGFNDEQLIDFIICCLDAFPRPEKRVYCYLPSIDRDGSLSAKCLMETLLRVLPPCVNAGAGFITYSSTFHSPSTNPIPGNISVVFIPDTLENRQREILEKSRNYIFDFENYEKQYTVGKNGYIDNLIEWIRDDMMVGSQEKTQQFYKKLTQFVKEDIVVEAEFLGFFWVFQILSANIEKKLKERDKRFILALANDIAQILEFEDILTEFGKKKISEEVAVLMHQCQFTADELEWIDSIYKSGKLCKAPIIEFLCKACLSFVQDLPHDQNEEILAITNFEYTDVDLNDHILHMIYSREVYFGVGQRLFWEMLKPLRMNSDKSDVKKRTQFFNLIGELYEEYPKFVTSSYFIEEATAFLTDFLNKVDEMRDEMAAIQEAIEKMDMPFQRAYYPVLQELSYIVVQEFSQYAQRELADEIDLRYYECLIQQFQLEKYEAEKKIGQAHVHQLEMEIQKRQLDIAFFSMNVSTVLRVFNDVTFEKAVKYCKENLLKVTGYLDRYEDNAGKTPFFDWMNLFLYFYCIEDRRTMERCLFFVIKRDGLAGLIDFYQRAHQKKDSWEYSIENRTVRMVIESNEDFWCRQELSSSDEAFLAEMGVRGVTGCTKKLPGKEESRHQDSYENTQLSLESDQLEKEAEESREKKLEKQEKESFSSSSRQTFGGKNKKRESWFDKIKKK